MPPASPASTRPDLYEIRIEPRAPGQAEPASRRRPVPWLRQTVASAAIVAGLSYLAEQRVPPDAETAIAAAEPVVLTAPPPAWQPVLRAAPLYRLDAAIRPAVAAATRVHANGGREDTFVAGAFGDPLHLRLVLLRLAQEEAPPRFYVDLVRRAAEASVSVLRVAQPFTSATKFGPIEIAEAALEDGRDGQQGACLAFRLIHPDFAFRLQGWLCGPPAEPIAVRQLLCTIDRLALAGGAGDPVLKALFARADRSQSESCAKGPQMATARR